MSSDGFIYNPPASIDQMESFMSALGVEVDTGGKIVGLRGLKLSSHTAASRFDTALHIDWIEQFFRTSRLGGRDLLDFARWLRDARQHQIEKFYVPRARWEEATPSEVLTTTELRSQPVVHVPETHVPEERHLKSQSEDRKPWNSDATPRREWANTRSGRKRKPEQAETDEKFNKVQKAVWLANAGVGAFDAGFVQGHSSAMVGPHSQANFERLVSPPDVRILPAPTTTRYILRHAGVEARLVQRPGRQAAVEELVFEQSVPVPFGGAIIHSSGVATERPAREKGQVTFSQGPSGRPYPGSTQRLDWGQPGRVPMEVPKSLAEHGHLMHDAPPVSLVGALVPGVVISQLEDVISSTKDDPKRPVFSERPGPKVVGGAALEVVNALKRAHAGSAVQSQRPATRGTKARTSSRVQDPRSAKVPPQASFVTIVSRPIKVASAGMEQSGSAISMDIHELAKSSGKVTPSVWQGLSVLADQGAQVIYPALSRGELGPDAANFQLSEEMVQELIGAVGPQRLFDLAPDRVGGSTLAGVAPVQAQLVPFGRPSGSNPAILPQEPGEQKSELQGVGGQSRRGGVLDVLGVPVRLAPSLGGRSEVADQVAARSGRATSPSGTALRPEVFTPLQRKLMPSAGAMDVEPARREWDKAAPAFGIQDSSPVSILSPDSRIRSMAPSEPNPQTHVGAPTDSSVPFSPRGPAGAHSTPMGALGHLASASGLGSVRAPLGPELPGTETALHRTLRPAIPAMRRIPANASPAGADFRLLIPTLGRESIEAPAGALRTLLPQLEGQSPVVRRPLFPRLEGFEGGKSHANVESLAEPRGNIPPVARQRSGPARIQGVSELQATHPWAQETPVQEEPRQLRGRPIVNYQLPELLIGGNRPDPRVHGLGAPSVQASSGSRPTTGMQASAVNERKEKLTAATSGTAAQHGAEVRMMANEVWTILKRRISSELDRVGRA